MREGVGMLLAELMRIKAEGDYDCDQGADRQVRRTLSIRSCATRWWSATRKLGPADQLFRRHQRRSDR